MSLSDSVLRLNVTGRCQFFSTTVPGVMMHDVKFNFIQGTLCIFNPDKSIAFLFIRVYTMKSGLGCAMSGHVSLEMDSQDARPPHLSRNAVLHSRSASWSFTRGQGRGASDLGLAALNPLTTVIRELVPSFGHGDVMTPESLSRAASHVSLSLTRATGYDSQPSFGTETPTTETQPSGEAQPQFPEEQNVGPEMGDGVRWLEHNAVFAVILLLRFAWFHRSGESFVEVCVGT